MGAGYSEPLRDLRSTGVDVSYWNVDLPDLGPGGGTLLCLAAEAQAPASPAAQSPELGPARSGPADLRRSPPLFPPVPAPAPAPAVAPEDSCYYFPIGTVTFSVADAQALAAESRLLVSPMSAARCPWCQFVARRDGTTPYALCLQPHVADRRGDPQGPRLSPLITPRLWCRACLSDALRAAGVAPAFPAAAFLAAALAPAGAAAGAAGFVPAAAPPPALGALLATLRERGLFRALAARLATLLPLGTVPRRTPLSGLRAEPGFVRGRGRVVCSAPRCHAGLPLTGGAHACGGCGAGLRCALAPPAPNALPEARAADAPNACINRLKTGPETRPLHVAAAAAPDPLEGCGAASPLRPNSSAVSFPASPQASPAASPSRSGAGPLALSDWPESTAASPLGHPAWPLAVVPPGALLPPEPVPEGCAAYLPPRRRGSLPGSPRTPPPGLELAPGAVDAPPAHCVVATVNRSPAPLAPGRQAVPHHAPRLLGPRRHRQWQPALCLAYNAYEWEPQGLGSMMAREDGGGGGIGPEEALGHAAAPHSGLGGMMAKVLD